MNQILYSGKAKKKPVGLIIGVIIIFIAIFCLVGFGIANLSNEKILKGVIVANVDVSDMTKEEAIAAIDSLYAGTTNRNITLVYEDYSLEISTLDIGFGYTDASVLVEEAYNYGRSGNIFENNFVVMKSYLDTKKNIETEEKIDVEKLEMLVGELMSGETIFSEDDKYEVKENKLLITKGVEGKKIDYETLANDIILALREKDIYVNIPVIISEPKALDIDEVYAKVHTEPVNASYKSGQNFEIIKEVNGIDFDKALAKEKYFSLKSGETAEIELQVVEPETKLADLGDVLFQNKIAEFKSEYDTTDTNRVTNLQIAANKCNNTILYPGDEFSYNKALGNRTVANGYKPGHSFAGGKVVTTIGGGICQVSSTLYNAVLRANLTITDRTAHGMYVQYVPQSTDATVVDGSIDFKFRNDRKYPVKLVTTCENGVVTAAVYGFQDADEATIDIETKIIETIAYKTVKQNDSSMKKGTTKVVQEPVDGYVSEAYKVYYKNGKEISRELISKDTYSATNEIIKVGTKVAQVVTPPSEPVKDPEPETPAPILPPGWDNPESGY